MAMLIAGVWSEIDQIIKNGKYVRQTSVHNGEISDHIIKAISEHPGRFHLIASWSCPWSHRAMLIRQLKGLENYIPLHMTGGKRVEGYPANFGKSWSVPGTDINIVHLHQLYTLNDRSHTGRPTVPVLWDSQEQKIVSNESSKIMRAFNSVKTANSSSVSQADFTLVPEALVDEIDSINDRIYKKLSNGVYRARFAQSQSAHQIAVTQVFDMLDELEEHLATNRYLMGASITEADWRLFPTLLRFDIDYFIHSRCSRHRLVDYRNLWAYARDLYAWDGVTQTINMEAIHLSNYSGEDIVAEMPSNDWAEPHDRGRLGARNVTLYSGKTVSIDTDNSTI